MDKNSPDNGTINKAPLPLSFLPSPDSEGEWLLWEIRNREKLILDIGGEKVKLLKRKWEGTRCSICWDEVRKTGEADCEACFGTGIEGGYYPAIDIVISLVNPAVKVIEIQDHGMRRTVAPRSWTLWEPQLQNKDLVFTKQGEGLWILNVTPTLWRGLVLHQNFDTDTIEHSNVIYKLQV